MRRFALMLGVALSMITTSAVAQNCDGFTDVLASSPFCPDVTWVTGYGITKGCGGSQFCPNENVTRLQMAIFMHRFGENPAFVNGGNAFGIRALLGTNDNYPLVVLVAGRQAMLVQPAVESYYGFNPNVINGPYVNSVAGGIAGATIAAGGGCNPGTGGTCSIGTSNQVTATFGTVGGGTGNTADSVSTVAGGYGNTASGFGAAIAGGYGNTASGEFATVPGGTQNSAAGAGSVVMGYNGETTSAGVGSFVFSDSTGTTPYGSGKPNEFLVAASGGIRMDTAKDYATGCNIPAGGGAWSCSSSRDIKRDFTDVDSAEILAKVAALPVMRWRYVNEPADVRHIGTFAQEFRAAFGLGNDDKSISTVDADGIAMAAIQGLNAKVEQQQREIAELRERVQRAEAVAADVVALKAALAELQRGRETVAVK